MLEMADAFSRIFNFCQMIFAGDNDFGIGMLQDIACLVLTKQKHDGHDDCSNAPDGPKAGKNFRRIRHADHYMVPFSNTKGFQTACKPASHVVYPAGGKFFVLKDISTNITHNFKAFVA